MKNLNIQGGGGQGFWTAGRLDVPGLLEPVQRHHARGAGPPGPTLAPAGPDAEHSAGGCQHLLLDQSKLNQFSYQ